MGKEANRLRVPVFKHGECALLETLEISVAPVPDRGIQYDEF